MSLDRTLSPRRGLRLSELIGLSDPELEARLAAWLADDSYTDTTIADAYRERPERRCTCTPVSLEPCRACQETDDPEEEEEERA